MADGTAAAVDQATRLGEIGFPEFTTKLVTDVFDSLVAANLRQVQSYAELQAAVSKNLSEYINSTKDDIGGEQVMQWLASVSPALFDGQASNVGQIESATLDADGVKELDAALAIRDETGTAIANPSGLTANQAVGDAKDDLIRAVASRIAADKYTLLKQMVKMGMLRLIVESGVIETRLTFNTYGSSVRAASASKYNSSQFAFRAGVRTPNLIGGWLGASASTSYSSISVSTANNSQQDVSGSNVQIFGRVQINFKTDYAPLAEQ
jgi:hypothetical protein